MRLLIDMNLSPDWVTFLRAHGYEADHWSSIGPADAADIAIMRYAQEHAYAVLTNDLDFGIMLALSIASKPSVIQVRSDKVLPTEIGMMVRDVLRGLEAQIIAGALVTVHPAKTRVTLLPFKST